MLSNKSKQDGVCPSSRTNLERDRLDCVATSNRMPRGGDYRPGGVSFAGERSHESLARAQLDERTEYAITLMLSGKRFRLKRTTISIETTVEDRMVVMVPTGAVVTVLSGPRPDDMRMVDILWDRRTLVMFAVDILERGEEITDKSAKA